MSSIGAKQGRGRPGGAAKLIGQAACARSLPLALEAA
jgi:hypothetical protein